MRRKSDQLVTAQLLGLRFAQGPAIRAIEAPPNGSQWICSPSPGASTYEFLFSGLAENVEYYVEAGAVQSKHYNLKVIDLPGIKKIRVTYHYPAWSGLKDSVEDPGGDFRAVEGTDAEVAIQTDRPLNKGVLMLSDDRQSIEPVPSGGRELGHRPSSGQRRHVSHRGHRRGENVRMSEDFFIEARKDSPPRVKINRPGNDAKVNPIEEVTVKVNAEDDFALNEVTCTIP